jgi:hypothetical protein
LQVVDQVETVVDQVDMAAAALVDYFIILRKQ